MVKVKTAGLGFVGLLVEKGNVSTLGKSANTGFRCAEPEDRTVDPCHPKVISLTGKVLLSHSSAVAPRQVSQRLVSRLVGPVVSALFLLARTLCAVIPHDLCI